MNYVSEEEHYSCICAVLAVCPQLGLVSLLTVHWAVTSPPSRGQRWTDRGRRDWSLESESGSSPAPIQSEASYVLKEKKTLYSSSKGFTSLLIEQLLIKADKAVYTRKQNIRFTYQRNLSPTGHHSSCILHRAPLIDQTGKCPLILMHLTGRMKEIQLH